VTIEPTILDHVPIWAFILAILGIATFTAECGYRLGQHRKSKAPVKQEDGGTVVGATLSLTEERS